MYYSHDYYVTAYDKDVSSRTFTGPLNAIDHFIFPGENGVMNID